MGTVSSNGPAYKKQTVWEFTRGHTSSAVDVLSSNIRTGRNISVFLLVLLTGLLEIHQELIQVSFGVLPGLTVQPVPETDIVRDFIGIPGCFLRRKTAKSKSPAAIIVLAIIDLID